MDVAISGSTGLIGNAFFAALEKRGDRAIRIVRTKPTDDEIGWDPGAGRIDAAALDGVDAIVNLSGESLGNKRWTPAQKAKLESSRIGSTTLLAETMANLENKPSVFLSGSAVGYYGDRGDEELTEQSGPGSIYLAGLAKRWEEATAAAAAAGIRVCLLRTGVVISPHGGAVRETLLPFKLGLGGRIGSGDQYWSWVSIDDQVGAMLHLLDQPEIRGPVNITGPNPATNAEYTRAFGDALNRPTFIPTPMIALYIRLGKEATENMLLASAKALPQRLIDSGYTFRHETVEEAFTELLT